MAIEQYTESLTLKEMKCVIGKNSFGDVLPQGDVLDIDKIDKILKRAGGKPMTNVPSVSSKETLSRTSSISS